MRYLTLSQIEEIATKHKGEYSIDNILDSQEVEVPTGMPAITFTAGNGDEYGIEWTDTIGDTFLGEHFFGKTKYQKCILPLINEISENESKKKLLTLKNWKDYAGQKLELSYSDVNRGTERIEIVDCIRSNDKSIGQDYGHDLVVYDLNENFERISEKTSTWIYEWQGIFRRGSGAERLFIEKIIK